jgi:hypothetical protein
MKRIPSYLILILAALHLSCNKNPIVPEETQMVLRGYLYENKPVHDIQITSSISIASGDTTYPPISNATVILTKNGTRYPLSPDVAQPGYYYYAGNDVSVNVGDDFTIDVDHNGQHVTAETVVPQKPVQVAISVSTLRFQRDTIETPFGTRTTVTGLDSAIVTWSNQAGDYFFITTESVDPSRQLLRDSTSGGMFSFRSISQPTNRASFRINDNSILYTGTHILRVYHVNKEYADLYRSRQQDSRVLNEPLTNVKNGLGIFTSFASDSLYFTATLDAVGSR